MNDDVYHFITSKMQNSYNPQTSLEEHLQMHNDFQRLLSESRPGLVEDSDQMKKEILSRSLRCVNSDRRCKPKIVTVRRKEEPVMPVKSKKAKKPKPPAIRLSRHSSARDVMKASEHSDLPEEDMSLAKGKGLQNQHALALLQQVNKAIGEPFHPTGLSFHDKVNSLKVDNASKLLKEMTWVEFFSGKTVETARRENGEEREKHERAAQFFMTGASSYRHRPQSTEGRISPSPSMRAKADARDGWNTNAADILNFAISDADCA